MNSDPEAIIDDDLPPDVLYAIGQITVAWAQLDAFISAAFFSILNIDPVDFGIVIGRTESPTKLVKMQQIFKHRQELRKAAVMKKAKELIEDLRPLRNTLTHGRYIGKTARDEFCFILPAEFVMGEEIPTANEMVVVERSDLVIPQCGRSSGSLGMLSFGQRRRLASAPPDSEQLRSVPRT
jgi:hypothetical protein